MSRRHAVRPAPAGDGEHIVIVVQNMSVPLDRRVWSECLALRRRGNRVSVICPRGDGDASEELLEGVAIHRYSPAPPAKGPLGYAVEFAWCWLLVSWIVLRLRRRSPIAVLQACNPPDTYWLLGRFLQRSGTRFVFDHHDLCPELYRSRGGPVSPLLLRLLEWLERATYLHADAVITTNESYRQIAAARTGRSEESVTVVRSAPDPGLMRRGAPRPELRDGHQHLACYLGIMGPQDGVDVVVRAAAVVVHELGRHDIRFALLGYGDCEPDLRRLAVELEVGDHVHFTGRVGSDEIAAWLSSADVGLSPDPWTPFNDVSTMNKTLEYLAYELPVLSFELRETVVSAGPAAVYVTPQRDPRRDVRAYAEALVDLLDQPDRRAAMGRLGRARIEGELGWQVAAARYLEVYDHLLGAPARTSAPEAQPRPEPVGALR